MRKVRVKERKMNWSLIVDGSNQQNKQAFVSTWSQIWPKRVEISDIHSNSTAPPLSRQPRFILFISAIVLAIVSAIASIFVAVFGLESRDFGGFNNVFNVFVNENKWKKSGLTNNEYCVCDILSSPVFNTIGAAADTSTMAFYLHPTGVELAEFGDL